MTGHTKLSDAQNVLLLDAYQLSKDDDDGDGWVEFEANYNGCSILVARALARRGLVEARRTPEGYAVRLTARGRERLDAQ